LLAGEEGGKGRLKPDHRRNDRENIDLMRRLFNDATKNQVFQDNTDESVRLEFSYCMQTSYIKHQVIPKEIILNPNTHCMTTSNDRQIHVWHPVTGHRLFSVSFDAASEKARELKEGTDNDRKDYGPK
jgi:hypothetical protein